MTHRDTPRQWSRASPAEVVMGKRLENTPPTIPTDTVVMINPAVNPAWRVLWAKKEAMRREHCARDAEGPPAKKARLQPLTANTKVLIHSQTGGTAPRWEKTGTVMETLPSGRP